MGKKKGKILLKVVEDKEKHTDMEIDCTIPSLIGIAINVLTVVSNETGIDYNLLVDDIKEIKKEGDKNE